MTFFYSYWAITRLSENNCETCLKVYVQNTCFPFGTHLSYTEKRNGKIPGRSNYYYTYSEVYLLGGNGGWSTLMLLFSIVLASILRKLSEQCLPFVTGQVSTCKNVRRKFDVLTRSLWHNTKVSHLTRILLVCFGMKESEYTCCTRSAVRPSFPEPFAFPCFHIAANQQKLFQCFVGGDAFGHWDFYFLKLWRGLL